MPARRKTTWFVSTSMLLVPVLVSCSEDPAPSGAGPSAAIGLVASDDACSPAQDQLAAGSTTFSVTNKGSKITELYVYGQQDGSFSRVITEVENIGPGTTRDLTVTLEPGTYELACKPGQAGNGIRHAVTVSSPAASAGAATAPAPTPSGSPSPRGYDREIELSTDGRAISGTVGAVRVGDRIEVKLTNRAAGQRILEIKKPDGTVATESSAIQPGASGEVVLGFDASGRWQIIVEGDGVQDVTAPVAVG